MVNFAMARSEWKQKKMRRRCACPGAALCFVLFCIFDFEISDGPLSPVFRRYLCSSEFVSRALLRQSLDGSRSKSSCSSRNQGESEKSEKVTVLV